MREMSQIENQVLVHLLSGQLAGEPVGVDTDLIQSGLLDSMLVMDLVHFIESQFSVSLDPTDIAPRNLRTVTAVAKCVADKRVAASKAA